MKFGGQYRIEASREAVWAAINDPEVLRQCIPGCEEMVRDGENSFAARVLVKVGPVKARFSGRVEMLDLVPPESCRLTGEGTGGPAGFAKGGAVVRLEVDGTATVLTYEADSEIGGKVAQIGARLIDSFARKYADDFFARFSAIVGSAQDATGQVAAQVAQEAAAPVPAPSAGPVMAPVLPQSQPVMSGQNRGGEGWFNGQSFTIVVLALLLVFMTIMYATKA